MGSLARATWTKIAVCVALLAVVVPVCMTRSWMLTALTMGDERASSLGVPVARLRLEMLACISILASTAVAFVGTIGFIGLVGPHIARMLVGEDSVIFCLFPPRPGPSSSRLRRPCRRASRPG